MINLDPQKLNVDENRKKRRRKLFKYASFPLIVLFFLSAFVLRTTFFNIDYRLAYKDNHVIDAIKAAEDQQIANIIDPSIAHYDMGIAKLLDEKYTEAEQSFRDAIEAAPPAKLRCKIIVNLSLSIELQASKQSGDELYSDAITTVGRAQSILRESGCADNDSQAIIALQRLQETRQQYIQKLTQKEKPNRSNDSDFNDEAIYSDLAPSDEDVNKALDGFDQTDEVRKSLYMPDKNYDYDNKKPW
jgi:hypothetical protein